MIRPMPKQIPVSSRAGPRSSGDDRNDQNDREATKPFTKTAYCFFDRVSTQQCWVLSLWRNSA
jgi:hypothetical protein